VDPYYLVLFENRTKPGTVLSETVLSGDPLYFKEFGLTQMIKIPNLIFISIQVIQLFFSRSGQHDSQFNLFDFADKRSFAKKEKNLNGVT